jgi:hypothetical protein
MRRRTIAVLFVVSWFSLSGQAQKRKSAYDYITVIDSWKALRITGVNVKRPPSEVFTINLRGKRNVAIDTVYAFWKDKALKGRLIRNNNMTEKAAVSKGEKIQLNFIDVPEMKQENGRLTVVKRKSTNTNDLKVCISINGELLSFIVHPKEKKELPKVLPE